MVEGKCFFPEPRLEGRQRGAVVARMPEPDGEASGVAVERPQLDGARSLRVDDYSVRVDGDLTGATEFDLLFQFVGNVPSEEIDQRRSGGIIHVATLHPGADARTRALRPAKEGQQQREYEQEQQQHEAA